MASARWAEQVCAHCDPVFAAADVGFERQLQHPGPGSDDVTALLWEADPERFAARYPESGIDESYGGSLADVPCIDYWVYLDEPGQARISVEGFGLPELLVPLTGHGTADGRQLAAVFARILGVAGTPGGPGALEET